jgi:DNA-binding NarL/FixJ family response regulator
MTLSHRVVIISPLRIYCQGLERQLIGSALEVVGTATTPSGALEIVDRRRPQFVLIDVSSDDLVSIVSTLRRVHNARVIAFAVGHDDSDAIVCAEMGVAAFVTKDATIDQLVEIVVGCSRGELQLKPSLAGAVFRRLADLSTRQEIRFESSQLTARERDILALIRRGMSNKEIANRLRLHISTVKNHVHHILEKLGVSRREQAAAVSETAMIDTRRSESAKI